MLAGEPFDAGDPELENERRRSRRRTAALNGTAGRDPAARAQILSGLLGSIGEGSEILSPFQCDYGYQITVGARSFMNFGGVILDSSPVTIGDDVQIGPNVSLVTAMHPLDAERRRTHLEWGEPIVIADDVWLAAGVIVCAGVTIGAGTVVGAGSVVTRDLPARHLCVGSPCRPIRPV